MQILKDAIKKAVQSAFGIEIEEVEVEHPDNKDFGDYSTNISLKLAGVLKQSPMDIAKKLNYELYDKQGECHLRADKVKIFNSVKVLPPGFINFVFSEEWLIDVLKDVVSDESNYRSSDLFKKLKVMIEYTDPNPFKVFHIGHLMTNCVGESLAKIHEFAGAEVKRANYQGDVGIHVAKSIWGLIRNMKEEKITFTELTKRPLGERIEYLGRSYALGAGFFEKDDGSAGEIKELNTIIYKISQDLIIESTGSKPKINYSRIYSDAVQKWDLQLIKKIYKEGRNWSFAYFETLYKRLGTKFDYYYTESEAAEYGYEVVSEAFQKGVFSEDDGAIIFRGEDRGLHNRVFVSSVGLPVYEAKDLGLVFLKYQDFPYSKSIIITANEVDDYFKVVLKALEEINPELAQKTVHIGHGMMKFKEGKMSSRTGDVVAGDSLLNSLRDEVLRKMNTSAYMEVHDNKREEVADKIAVSAIKYNILKSGIGHDIVYDREEVLNLNGNTGPYILYTYARINSLLEKASFDFQKARLEIKYNPIVWELDLLRHIYKFGECVELSAKRLSPNLIAGFIYELSQKFNSFYAEVPVIKASSLEEREFRLYLTFAVGRVLRTGLDLLGIEVVDRM